MRRERWSGRTNSLCVSNLNNDMILQLPNLLLIGKEKIMKRIGLLLLACIMCLGFMPKTAMAAVSTYSEQDFANYLKEASSTRGFDVTKDDINDVLSSYEKSTEDFTALEDLKGFLGEVIKSNLSNIEDLYTKYNLDQDTLPALLNEYGDDLNDYVYVDELDTALGFYTESSKSAFSGIDKATVMSILSQFDLSEQEVTKLKDYFVPMSDYLNSAEVEAQMQTLQTKTLAILEKLKQEREANKNFKPSDEERKELASYYSELLSNLKINMKLSLVKGGSSTPLSLEEAMWLEELEDNDIKIEVYGSNSELLADFVITSDFIKSLQDKIMENGGNLVDKTDVKTVKGGKLPKTATNSVSYVLFGFVLFAAGTILYRKVRTDKVEIFEA